MSTIIIYVVMTAIIIMLLGIIYCLIKKNGENKDQIWELKEQLYDAKKTAERLSDFVAKMQAIKADEKNVAEKIKDAKDDEEIYSIVNDIIAINNGRLQNG